MQHSVLNKIESAFLIIGLAFALPAYAESHDKHDAMNMSHKGELGAQHMSAMMHDMSSQMKNISDMMESGNMNQDTMTKMSSQ